MIKKRAFDTLIMAHKNKDIVSDKCKLKSLLWDIIDL